MSQADFARAVGVSRSYVNAVVAGRRPISMDMVDYLARSHSIDAAWLQGGVAPDAAPSPGQDLSLTAAELLTIAERVNRLATEVVLAEQATSVNRDLHDLMNTVLAEGPPERADLVRRLLEALRGPSKSG